MNALPIMDAQATLGFVIAQTSIIEPTVYNTVYPEIQYRSLVPVDISGDEFAATATYFSQDQYGKADWINGNSDDIPKAGTTRAKFETPIHTAGIGYGYGWEEVGRARMTNTNLPAEDAQAARRAAEEMVDRVALIGEASKGFTGLFNASNVTPVPAPVGAWGTLQAAGTATPQQIVDDMNAALLNVFNGTNTTAIADRLLLPWSKYMLISTKRMSDYSDLTILQYFLANNVYTASTGQQLMVRGQRGLETAGAGGVARLVAYRYDANVLRLHMPMPHRFLEAQRAGPLRWEIPGVMRLGGLDVRLPKQVVYMDGV